MAKPKYMPNVNDFNRRNAGMPYYPSSTEVNNTSPYTRGYEPKEIKHPEIEALHTRVCNYLKKKIADEEQETQQYHKLESDARALTHGHIFLDVLFDAQATEVKELKTLYNDICIRGQK